MRNFFNQKLLIVLYAGIVAFLSVVIFYRIQEADYVMRLNNSNLSNQSYQIQMKKGTKVSELLERVTKSEELEDAQIHFQDRHNSQRIYFYGQGKFSIPPMISGSFFSTSDFTSAVETAVVGKDWEKKLYQPKDQAYLKQDGQYIPVVGIMGSKYKSQLDKQVFISMSNQRAQNTAASAYRIIIDTATKQPVKSATFQKILGAQKVKKLFNTKLITKEDSWVALHSQQALQLVGIVVMALFEILFWIMVSRKDVFTKKFITLNRDRILFHQLALFSFLNGLGLVLGTMLGIFKFSFTTYTSLLMFLGGLYIILLTAFGIIFAVILDKKKKEE